MEWNDKNLPNGYESTPDDEKVTLWSKNSLLDSLQLNREEYLNNAIDTAESEKKKAYFMRIKKLLGLKDLSKEPWNPIALIIDSIKNDEFYSSFEDIEASEIASEWATFDVFNFPEDHVARRTSDSYFLLKSNNVSESILLRPHTSIVRYDYLMTMDWKKKLEEEGEIKILSSWKVYRVDTLDPTHHECFHQIDWLRIVKKDKEIITQETLKDVLTVTIKAVFGDDVEFKFYEDSFPYTVESLEAYVKFEDKWIEVLGAWIVHPSVLEKLWINSDEYNWRAYWFWIERLAMALKKVPDIRIFWSEDERVTNQRWNFEPYEEISKFPPVYKDISLVVPKNKFVEDTSEWADPFDLNETTESNFFEFSIIARNVWWDLIEAVEITDIFKNDAKFWEELMSITLRITFRSLERTLTNEEINKMYFDIRHEIENWLGYELR